MRLKSLEIQGYKSFALKSTFNFDGGITAVVGPNGSGKSNVSDAIRWVLGEQSYSALRGQRTTDMIFAGSTQRARVGMASVSIVLDNSDGSLPLDYNEVTISRRAYRSGENEYLINNNRVRLKDVAEILARSGLARQTYTSIGQGTIDKALSLKAEERRQLFEEAAGITYHRQQRSATLRHLDETHANLLRVNDIIKEIEPRLKRLEKQVEKVEAHKNIRLHLDGLLKVWYGHQWGQKQADLHRAKVRATISEERLKEEQQKFHTIETRIKTLRARQTEIRNQLGLWHAKSSKIHTQAEIIQRELAVGEERARQLSAQREEFVAEIDQLQELLKSQQEQVAQAQKDLAEINQTYQNAENAVKTAQKALDTHQRQRQSLIHIRKQAEERAQKAAHALTDRQSRRQQLAERTAALQTQKEEQAHTLKTLLARQTETEAALKTVQAQLAELDAARQTFNEAETAARQTYQTLQETAQTLSVKLTEKEKSLSSLQARLDLLDRLRTDMSGYHEGVKEVLQTSLPGVKGTVAQLLQVPNHLETAIELALGGRLQDVVVDSWSNAEIAIEHLKKTQTGRATFLPIDKMRPPEPLEIPQTGGIIGLATDLVKFDPAITAVAENLLNRILIATDLKAARRAFDSLKGNFMIVTQAGEITRSSGAVTGGETKDKGRQGGMLAREREWRELPAQITQKEAEIASVQTGIAANAAAQADVQTTLKNLEEQKLEGARRQAQIQQELNRQNLLGADLKNQIGWTEGLQLKADQEIKANQNRREEITAEIARLAQEQKDAEQDVTRLQEEIAGLSAETLLNQLNQAQNNLSLAREKQQSRREWLKTFTNNLNQTQLQLNSRQGRIASLAQQREALLERLETQRQEHTTLVEAIKEYTDQIEPAETTLKKLEASQETSEAEETRQREFMRRMESDNNLYALELARRQDDMDSLQRQIEDDFGLVQLEMSEDQIGQPVLPLHSVVTELPTVEQLPEGIEDDIRHLKIQLRQLGQINPEAPREYQELQERFDFLSTQMADLEKASRDLKTVIDELDKIMHESFINTFNAVAKQFQSYFKILFNGGEAELILTSPDDITQTGVEIIARPPGKRPQSLELLSGGERSLTAQALIFSLLKTSPTPYCVFDEVDAMLDEANVDRFKQTIVALSQDIQFIIITHNRKTIEIADTVYGISMGNDAVSRVVSLKLDDIPEDNVISTSE